MSTEPGRYWAMSDSAESPARRHERIADMEHGTEERMHVTARFLPEPQRSAMHRRASKISERAEQHRRVAERLRKRQGKTSEA